MTKVASKDRTLTVSEAADQWAKAKRIIDEQKPLLEQAAPVLKEHFRRTGRRTYKDVISYTTGTREVLKQAEVRAYLGKKVSQFLNRIDTEQLSLLK